MPRSFGTYSLGSAVSRGSYRDPSAILTEVKIPNFLGGIYVSIPTIYLLSKHKAFPITLSQTPGPTTMVALSLHHCKYLGISTSSTQDRSWGFECAPRKLLLIRTDPYLLLFDCVVQLSAPVNRDRRSSVYALHPAPPAPLAGRGRERGFLICLNSTTHCSRFNDVSRVIKRR